MLNRTSQARLGLLLVLCGSAAVPATGSKWPGEGAGLGSAIAAKVIGQQCAGVLTASEIRELDAYLARSASELASKPDAMKHAVNGRPFFETLMADLTATYSKKYRDPNMCDVDATEEAQDMLRRVRKAMASDKPLYPDENDPDRKPDVGEAITAKVTGEKCRNALAAIELAELELYIARSWVRWARTATDADARSTMDSYKSAERAIADGWRPRDCTAEAVAKAKRIAALARKAEASDVP